MFYQKRFRKTATALPLAAGVLFVFSVIGAPAMGQESPTFEIGDVIYENPLSSPEDVEDGLHDFTLTFFESGGGHHLDAAWEGPGFNKQTIPADVSFHVAAKSGEK